jgi:DNA polymerase-3 subunit delta'
MSNNANAANINDCAFGAVVGHSRIVRSLLSSIAVGKVSHAYIFSGLSGSGKSLIAASFAKALQCENDPAQGPCDSSVSASHNICKSCRVFGTGNHPDIFFVSPKGKSLGVGDIREQIIKNMETRPYLYRRKVFIIDSAHTMTPQAQNALLKTIEEPADYGVFLLLSEGLGAFLPTVLSRCIVYKLDPLSYDEVYGYLTASGIAPGTARLATVYAQGNIGRGLQLASDEDFIGLRIKIFDIMNRLRSADLTGIFAIAKQFDEFKDRIQEALDIMYLCYRDALVLRSAGQRFVIQEDMPDVGRHPTAGLSAVWQAKRRLRHHTNFQLTIEVMLLNITLVSPQ